MKIKGLPGQLLHGGDYNPEQWLDMPEILEEDIRLMREAHINCVTLGVFSWSRIEPAEGQFELDYLGELIDRLYENGIHTILATPTGAMPRWLTDNYEEVNRVDKNGTRRIHGLRHNFCPTSPKMRSAMQAVDTALAMRFGRHPGVIAWHISNEYAGGAEDCHCPRCQQAFRTWLKKRYGSMEKINHAWWTDFWSNRISDWKEIHSPVPYGETELNGLLLDWRRFVSDQMIDFARAEVAAVRKYSDAPCTTNRMGAYPAIDDFKLAKEFDFMSLDCYPFWHVREHEAERAAFAYSLTRSLKKQPFLLMESVPSAVQWMDRCTLKRPGMHELSSLQAIANGSNSVQYFQWRKGRGGMEKYHGAVIDHKNAGNTRVYRDVQRLGQRLEAISEHVLETINRPQVAIVYDWENMWALEHCNHLLTPFDAMEKWMPYFRALTRLGVEADVVDMTDSLEGYSVVIAPLNYMYRGNYVETVKRYVQNGGCYVTTYFSGEVDDSDLCFLGEHPLRELLGVRTEEIDVRPESVENHILYRGRSYPVGDLCALVHAEGAEVLGCYEQDFYRGFPALTRNSYGSGDAYFIAAEGGDEWIEDLYEDIGKAHGIERAGSGKLPEDVLVSTREGTHGALSFFQNYSSREKAVKLSCRYRDIETKEVCDAEVSLAPYQCRILQKNV